VGLDFSPVQVEFAKYSEYIVIGLQVSDPIDVLWITRSVFLHVVLTTRTIPCWCAACVRICKNLIELFEIAL